MQYIINCQQIICILTKIGINQCMVEQLCTMRCDANRHRQVFTGQS